MLGGQIRSPKDFEEGDFRTFAPRFSEEVSTYHPVEMCWNVVHC
jgi:hypothetical protein